MHRLSAIPAVARIPGRRVLRLSGKDTVKFLKGLTSRDVDNTPGWGYSSFLTPTGRVLHDVFIYPIRTSLSTDPTYLIDHPAPSTAGTSDDPDVPPLAKHLKKYILRAKVKVKDVTEEYDAWSVLDSPLTSAWRPHRSWKFGSGGAAEPTWDMGEDASISALQLADSEVGSWDLRAGWGDGNLGRRLLTRKGDVPSMARDHQTVSDHSYYLRRALTGVPEGPEELIPNAALPLESSMDVMGGIDFRKGCYVGQELTVRTYHTGNTRKRIMPVRFSPPTTPLSAEPLAWSDWGASLSRPQAGDAIIYIPPADAASKKPKAGVRILSLHPDYAVGLGLVRLELAERVYGLPAFGQLPSVNNNGPGSARLVVGEAKVGDIVDNRISVWAGRGRAWYGPEADMPS